MPELLADSPRTGQFFPDASEGSKVSRFGDFNNRMGSIKVDLSVARSRELLQIAGTLLWAMDASSDVANVYVSFGDDSLDDGALYRKGTALAGGLFGKVYLTHAAQPGATMTFFYCVESYGQLRIVNPGINTSSIGIAANSNVGTVADVVVSNAVIQLLPADANRRAAYIVNTSVNAMRVGDQANVAVGRGVRIAGGASLTYTSTAALHAIREGAADAGAAITTESV